MIIRSYKGAGMILFHKDADGNVSVLLEKRSDNHSWAIPGGGLSPEDRTLMNTAIRETYEETGISVKDAEPVRIYRLPFFIYEVFVFSSASKGECVRLKTDRLSALVRRTYPQ